MLENFMAAYGYSILMGVAGLIVALILASWAGKAVRGTLSRSPYLDPTTVPLLAQTIRVAIIVLAAIVVLDEIGVDVASLIAALGIFGFAVAIGLRPTSTNFFAGIMLLILKPYRVSEYIEGERVSGVVESLHVFHTVVVTDEGTYVTVPNVAMWSRSIKNFSRPRARRMEIDLVVGRELPFTEIASGIDQIIRSEPDHESGIDPQITVVETAEDSITIRAAIWCDAELSWEVRKTLEEKLREGLTAAGVTVSKIQAPKKAAPKRRTTRPSPPADEDV